MLLGPSCAAGWLNTPWLAFALMAVSAIPVLAFEANYRRWRPWAIEAIGLPDPSTTSIAVKSILAEISIWVAVGIGASGWTLVGLRVIWGLVQLAEIGKFGRETDDHKTRNGTNPQLAHRSH